MQRFIWYHVYTGVIKKDKKEPKSLNDVTNTKSTLERLISKINLWYGLRQNRLKNWFRNVDLQNQLKKFCDARL